MATKPAIDLKGGDKIVWGESATGYATITNWTQDDSGNIWTDIEWTRWKDGERCIERLRWESTNDVNIWED